MRPLLAILLFPLSLAAAEPKATADPPLQVRLVSENTAIAPGKPFFLGLHLVHPPGTHTYWKHPGIVGLPTTIKWELPPGFTAGDIQWPAPQVVKMGSHDAQGYEGETLLMIPITPPESLSSPSVTLSAKASWMCCGNTCSPANGVPFSITLPVTDGPRLDPATASWFSTTRAMLPGSSASWRVSVTRKGGSYSLRFTPPAGTLSPEDLPSVRFFTADGQIDTDKAQHARLLTGGEWQLEMEAGESGPGNPTTLPGGVSFSAKGVTRSVEINPPLSPGD